MIRRNKVFPYSVLALISVTVSFAAFPKGNPDTGKQLSLQGDGNGAPCLACHGSDGEGNAAGSFPYIAGMNEGYLLRQLTAYQAGARDNAVMAMNVDDFTEQQLSDLAAYYASLDKPSQTASDVDPELIAQGKKLVTVGDWEAYIPPCSTCHGPNNRGVDQYFPGIAGQHASYIKQQISAWKNNQRTTDNVQLMEAVAKRLTDEQIEAVSAYLASIPAKD